MLKYQTILTAHIFQQTTPLSNYLQTCGMDLLTAHRFVTSTQDNLKEYARDLPGELCDDTTISDADSMHNVILDTIIESISRRFAKNRELYTDFALLDNQNFNDWKCRRTQCPERQTDHQTR